MFSELEYIAAETGLEYSAGRTALFGEKHGFGVTVADKEGQYIADIFCEEPSAHRAEITAAVSGVGESLPKNTLMSQTCGRETVTVVLDRYGLLQENAAYLIGFLDKLTVELEKLGIAGKEYRFYAEEKPAADAMPSENEVRVKLGFDLRSVLGMIGAVIGAAAMAVIAVLLVDVKLESIAFGNATEMSAYILSGITALVVFADYRFLARKLDACGIIVCPVLTVLAVLMSGIGAGVRGWIAVFGGSFVQTLLNFPERLAAEPMEAATFDAFITGYISRGILFGLLVSVGFCLFYFSRHPDETIRSEKVVSRGENPLGNIHKDR